MLVASYRWIAAGVLAALVATLGITAGAASPAQAQSVDVNCTGTLSTTLSPGLLLTPQTITTENSFAYDPCTSVSEADLVAGAHESTIVGEFSCLTPMGSFAGEKTIEWNTGDTSTFAFNSTHSTVGGQFVTVQTGAITGGPFAGAAALETIIGPTPDLLKCLHPPGITSRTSVVTLEIGSVA